ncbi:glycosyltransferase family 2 protein [Streptomyces sp. SID12501]|uniref:Glycosyltransferase family 2 protein n=1 Tax=Streptomyces sp. SID12501 TaxID=2706042 RepID=A0A6B3BTJ2_9ACTN|nr:glycosyltransferase family 2 protein [Streptomyces sp. SID12501]NEC87673.1 glycosyltransferase family 2 protein [Streptomyces sp. SID12501]
MSSFESTVPGEPGDRAVHAAATSEPKGRAGVSTPALAPGRRTERKDTVAEPGAVTIVVPTFNESANIGELLRRITESVPSRLACEVVFVDDSTDDTPEVISEAAQDCPFPVTVIHREEAVGGLGGAVVEGIKAATSDWIVVMDGDCQHPPSLVPELVATGERANAGLVVASRYIKGGSRAGLAGNYRVAVSRCATWLTKSLFPRRLHGISDPMSGFFAIRRSAVTADILQPLGYKILLELAVRSRPREVTEVPFVFQDRYAGESKSSAQEGLRFLRHLVGLRSASPAARMIGFGLIGATGFLPNLLGLYGLTAAGLHYVPAEILANQLGVAWNFLLIEHLLFRDRRRHRRWWDRAGRFAVIANLDLVLRLPLIALFVDRFGMGVLSATALALVTTFVLRFVGTEALVYLPRRGHQGAGRESEAARRAA